MTPQDEKILTEIKRATDCVTKNSLEQTAYFRALGAKNNLNLEKYRKQVENELELSSKKEEQGSIFPFSLIYIRSPKRIMLVT